MPKESRFFKVRKLSWLLILLVGLAASSCRLSATRPDMLPGGAPEAQPAMSYTVSMEDPASGQFQISFKYEGVRGNNLEIEMKMPAWSPGYYRVLNFAANVEDFRAEDETGRALAWEKTSENTWKIKTGGRRIVKTSYKVIARGQGVAESQLTEKRAYISPTSVFMFVPGKLNYPVRVTIRPHQNFTRISTGLRPAANEENTFQAENFDELYDCPIYVGNQEVLTFNLAGVPYELALEQPGDFNREEIISALKRLILAATTVVGEVPYQRYVFIMMGPGRGGLEHRNSMAVFSGMPRVEDRRSFQGWLSFIAHEFFHLYNVKAIRPVALGPFDYERANRTNMLWFSEGGTVYYEYLILKRAGFMSRDEILSTLSRIIERVESSPARKLESAAQASYRAWEEPFFGSEKTISYYDLGAVLTMLLDLKIRQETSGQRNLDDLMRLLYRRFYREQGRGFTDEEFRTACEEIAGVDLSEFFKYVYTTEPIDYDRYLGYVGLKLEVKSDENGSRRYSLRVAEELDGRQLSLLNSWL
ncbi:MAG: M61 family peptidase [Candidatus Saccharicenans sp.]|nr:M61 family peptidase [Candidatus Saccharicenans sp.]